MAQNAEPARGRTGLMLGKFMPPHAGHLYLAEFARRFVDRLVVLVCTLDREPIDGPLRYEWMRELVPDADVVHVTDDVPQEPSEHPEFWRIWRELIERVAPYRPDYVFASEAYGHKLAEVLDAIAVPVDPARSQVPISGTAVRADPLGAWAYLPPPVRAHYVRRVSIFGPESTGKSTLAARLAAHYKTVHATEWARIWLNPRGGRCDESDIDAIARGQIASEEALARSAHHVLFCDTDPLATVVWSHVLFGGCPDWIEREAARRNYHLTLLMDIDVPWVDDNQRYFPDPHRRRAFLDRCIAALERVGRPYRIVSGDWDERFTRTVECVDRMLVQSAAVE